MQLSVIILNYNVVHFLELCIHSVQKATKNIDAEIIVVDNASADGSLQMMHHKYPEIKLIANRQNEGFPKGNNLGFKHAKGDYVCILNPDTLVSEHCFEKLLHFAQADASTGIIGPQLVDGRGYFLPESKRSIPSPWVAITKILGLYKIFPNLRGFNQYYAMHIKINQTAPVDILVGAFMLMHHELYKKLDGFDEGCFMYSDDIDLSYRSLQAGHQNYYFAATDVIHFKGESTLRDQTYIKRFSDAMMYFYQKHYKNYALFKPLLKMVSWFFVFRKSNQKIEKFEANHHYVITKDTDLITKLNLSNLNKYNFRLFTDKDMNILKKQKSVVYFDTNTVDYTKIISFMKQQRGDLTRFRMIAPHHDYVIGSDSSNFRGIVQPIFFE